MSPIRRDRGRSALQRLGNRAVFAVALFVFLVLGILLVGDFSAQWWLLVFPVLLVVRPAQAMIREGGRHQDNDWETTSQG